MFNELCLLFNAISGANKQIYAPEPFDVGRILQAEITFDDEKVTVSTTAPIDPGMFTPELVNAVY